MWNMTYIARFILKIIVLNFFKSFVICLFRHVDLLGCLSIFNSLKTGVFDMSLPSLICYGNFLDSRSVFLKIEWSSDLPVIIIEIFPWFCLAKIFDNLSFESFETSSDLMLLAYILTSIGWHVFYYHVSLYYRAFRGYFLLFSCWQIFSKK